MIWSIMKCSGCGSRCVRYQGSVAETMECRSEGPWTQGEAVRVTVARRHYWKCYSCKCEFLGPLPQERNERILKERLDAK